MPREFWRDMKRRRRMKPRVLFVGEQSGGTVEKPAFGQPIGAARNLAKMLGVRHDEMLAEFEFINLLSPGRWSSELARQAGYKLQGMTFERAVLLGARVAEACGFAGYPALARVYMSDGRPGLLFPHPSGRNRLFNDAEFRRTCERRLRRFVR